MGTLCCLSRGNWYCVSPDPLSSLTPSLTDMRGQYGKWPGPTPCMAISWPPVPMTGKSSSGRRKTALGRRPMSTRDTTPQVCRVGECVGRSYGWEKPRLCSHPRPFSCCCPSFGHCWLFHWSIHSRGQSPRLTRERSLVRTVRLSKLSLESQGASPPCFVKTDKSC